MGETARLLQTHAADHRRIRSRAGKPFSQHLKSRKRELVEETNHVLVFKET